jgi:hypothetical protein
MSEETISPVENKNNEQTVVTQKTSRALLEILVYGLESEKAEIKKMMENIQNQMAKTKRGKYARILWYIDKGEKTVEEKKEWLIENANAKYYIFVPEGNTVKPDFVKGVLLGIKKFEDSLKTMHVLKIIPSRKKVENKPSTPLSIIR